MIKSFKCKEIEKTFHGRFSPKLPQLTSVRRIAQGKRRRDTDYQRTSCSYFGDEKT
jgi:hypothetical protein